jgi:hypothetical protein
MKMAYGITSNTNSNHPSITIPSSVSLLNKLEFGEALDIGGEGWYIQHIEEEDPRVTIVLHIYEPHLHKCVLINRHLDEIAQKWTHVKILKLQSIDSGVSVDPRQLPIISIYRGGKLAQVLKNFSDELTESRIGSTQCTREDVEW